MSNLQDFQTLFAKTGLVTELDFGDEGEFTGEITLWGHEAEITIMYSYGDESGEDDLPELNTFIEHAPKLHNRLNWLNDNKTLIAQTLMDGMGGFDWINDQIAQNGQVKIADGQVLTKSVSLDDIANSLRPIAVNFWIMSDKEYDTNRLGCSLALVNEPDYSGHLLTIEISDDDTMDGVAMDG